MSLVPSVRRLCVLAAVLACLLLAGPPLAPSAQAGTVRVGVLKFGTVNWELDVVQRHGFDRAEGVTVELLALAGKDATTIALQAGEVDVIVTDWLWVSRQRAEGADYTSIPYSTGLGALMVPADSPIGGLADLEGRRLGVAGGPLDKSWLVFRALSRREAGFDLGEKVDPVFGAPPLLNQQMLQGRLDAVINFWHYCARLEAAGMKRVMEVEDAVAALGIGSRVPLIGYVFDAGWATGDARDDLLAFQRAVQRARDLLAASDAEWEALRPLMRAEDEATFVALREGFRRAIPKSWGAAERADAARLFEVLAEIGGERLVGPSLELAPGTFWNEVSF